MEIIISGKITGEAEVSVYGGKGDSAKAVAKAYKETRKELKEEG